MAHIEEIAGSGTPIVLLHGILDRPDAWRPVARLLAAQGRRLLLVHSRAHGEGESYVPGMDWSPSADAADIVSRLPEGKWHLVGHSRGGTAASWIAADTPERVASLALIASPPMATEVFRAVFARRLLRATDPRERAALSYLATIPDDDFPQHALRRIELPSLVVEYEDDAFYSPTHTMFWRMFLPYADFERVPGEHRAFASEEGAPWLASRLLAHVVAAEAARSF